MDTNLQFIVNPVMKDGESLLDSPKVIPLPLNKNKGSCATAGIPVTDAFTNWNEDDNLWRWHWYQGSGNMGSFYAYFKDKKLYDSNFVYDGTSGVLTVPQGAAVGSACQYGGGKNHWPPTIQMNPNRQSRLSHTCWAGNNSDWWSGVDGPGPTKAPYK